MSQSRRHSGIESLVNVAVGYSLACITQVIIFPWFGLHTTLHQNMVMGGIFTVISLIRSYLIRRLFNSWK